MHDSTPAPDASPALAQALETAATHLKHRHVAALMHVLDTMPPDSAARPFHLDWLDGAMRRDAADFLLVEAAPGAPGGLRSKVGPCAGTGQVIFHAQTVTNTYGRPLLLRFGDSSTTVELKPGPDALSRATLVDTCLLAGLTLNEALTFLK